MKRALIVVAILGLLAWAAQVVLAVLLSHLASTPAYVTLATTDGYLEWIVPVLGVIAAILGVVRASRAGSQRMVAVFVTLGALVPTLLAGGFFIVILSFFSSDRTLEEIATIAVNIGLYFPVVVFVAALLYALRPAVQPATAQLQP